MRNNIHIFIGIDPDTDKSGIACWDSELKAFDYIKAMQFWEVIEEFEAWNIPFHVTISAGWLIPKSNFHNKDRIIKGKIVKQSKSVGEKIALAVGQNHEVGLLIEQYCIINGIPYTLAKPQGKVNAQTFKNITKWQKRTNQDMRDAAMLVFQKN